LWVARTPKKPDDATADESVEKSNTFLEQLRGAARRELKRQRGDPKSAWKRERGDPKSAWRRMRDSYPNLDEAAVDEIVENVAEVYQLIDDIAEGD
jgi:hypothetical protein